MEFLKGLGSLLGVAALVIIVVFLLSNGVARLRNGPKPEAPPAKAEGVRFPSAGPLVHGPCAVVRFKVEDVPHTVPTCAIRCQWFEYAHANPGASYEPAAGYSDMIPIDCSWYGHKLTLD